MIAATSMTTSVPQAVGHERGLQHERGSQHERDRKWAGGSCGRYFHTTRRLARCMHKRMHGLAEIADTMPVWCRGANRVSLKRAPLAGSPVQHEKLDDEHW